MSHGTMKYTLKAHVCYFVLMVRLLHYLYSLHANFYTSENIINIETEWVSFLIMDQNFGNNCQISYISFINIHLEKNCWFENWICKIFFRTFTEVMRTRVYYYIWPISLIYDYLWLVGLVYDDLWSIFLVYGDLSSISLVTNDDLWSISLVYTDLWPTSLRWPCRSSLRWPLIV